MRICVKFWEYVCLYLFIICQLFSQWFTMLISLRSWQYWKTRTMLRIWYNLIILMLTPANIKDTLILHLIVYFRAFSQINYKYLWNNLICKNLTLKFNNIFCCVAANLGQMYYFAAKICQNLFYTNINICHCSNTKYFFKIIHILTKHHIFPNCIDW